MKTKRFLFACVLILVLISGLFSACSSSTSSTTNSGNASSAATSITVSFGGSAALNTLDPHQMAGSYSVLCNIMDFLMEFDPSDNSLRPNIATDWQYSADYKTITFNIRDDVKFSNGDPLTAKDVVFSLKRVGSTQPPVMDQFRNAGFIDATVIDDYSFKVEIDHPSAVFLRQTMAQFLITSEDYFNEVGEEAFARNPLGSGPYKVVDFKEGESLDLTVNEYYWNKAPQIKDVLILSTQDVNTNVKMLQAGEVNLITGVPMQSVPTLQSSGYNIQKFPNTQTHAVEFALVNPNTPWSNVKVRQAINYAIDQDAIINQLFNGVPIKTQWQDPKDLGYDSSMQAVYPYDIEKAKQLMAEAGYADGFDFPITYLTDTAGIKDEADYVASALKAININVKLTGMSMGPEFFEYLGKEAKDTNSETGAIMWDISGPGQEDPAITLMYDFYSLRNALYTTPELDAIIGEALVTPDNTQRAALIKQAYSKINDEMPVVLLCRSMTVFAYDSNITLTQNENNMGKSGWIEDIIIK